MADFGDLNDVKEVKTAQELLELDKSEALGRLLDSPGGRAWLWDVLSVSKIYDDRMFAGENTHWTAFNAGKRSVGLLLLEKTLAVRPNAYVRMQVEASERAKQVDLIGEEEDNGDYE
ncbi:MAG: hypothetical protein O2884_08615 [Chloroflexi bacterium]|nr:hypothetical protein [Chloroflexota bacterium]